MNGAGNDIEYPRSALQRGLDVLNEINPEDDGSEGLYFLHFGFPVM